MKHFIDDYEWRNNGPYTAEEAVKNQLTPDAYANSGRLEELEDKVERLTALVAVLVDALLDNGALRGEDIARMCPGMKEAAE